MIMFPKKFLFFVFCLNTLVFGQYYINDGVFKFVTGVDFPLDIDMRGGSLGWFINIEVAYELPNNISFYDSYKVMNKRSIKNTFDRNLVYQTVEKYFDKLGVFGNECIYRLICEIGRRNINRDKNGLLGEIFHILFSPDRDSYQELEKYKHAKQQGLTNETDCSSLYNDCILRKDSVLLSW